MNDLDLPRGEERELVVDRDRMYELDDEDSRTLAAVGAFRVVPEHDLDIDHDTLAHLRDEGLVETVDLGDDERGLTLTGEGRDLLDSHSMGCDDEPSQAFYSGVSREREIHHDSNLYATYRQEEARLRTEHEGPEIRRVVLEQDLKRECRRAVRSRLGRARHTRAGARRRVPAHRYSRGSPHRASDIAPSLVGCCCWVVREDALTVAARGRSGEPEAPRRVAVALRALVLEEPDSWSVTDRALGVARVLTRRNGAAADQTAVAAFIRSTPGARQVVGVHRLNQVELRAGRASRIFTSWNQTGAWLRQIDGLRNAA